MSRVVWFDGYVDGWPVSWDGGIAEQSRVALGATDRLARLSDLRPLRAPLVEYFDEPGTSGNPATLDDDTVLDGGDVLSSSITFMFPLQEDPTATSAGDVSGDPALSYLTPVDTFGDARIEFGQSGVLPEGDMVTFTGAGAYRPQLVVTDPDFRVNGFRDWTCFAAFALPQAPTGTARLLRLAPVIYPGWPDPLLKVDVSVTALTVTWSGYAGVTPASVALTDTVALDDGRAHFLKIWHDTSGGIPGLFRMQVDARTVVSATAPDLMENVFRGLQIGNALTADPVSLAWVGWSPTLITDDLATMVLGLPERSDLRIARWLDACGFTTSEMDLEVGASNVGFVETTDRAALDAIADVQSVEQGVFFASGSRMVFHSREHRAGASSVLTLTGPQVGGDLAIDVNTTRLVNDYTVTRPGGATYRAINAESIRRYGRRTRSATIPAATDADLRAAADALVAKYGTPTPHCPSITLDLLTLDDDTVGAAMRLEVGDLIGIVDLPFQAPGESLGLFVEGLDQTVGVDVWQLRITTSPAGVADVSLLDSPSADLDTTAVLAY